MLKDYADKHGLYPCEYYVESGSYIEVFFPKYNVRYIAITDGVDSLTHQQMDITPFKNILNDMYSRDISKKGLAGIMTRSRQGKFCGGTPPYGLMRDPADKTHQKAIRSNTYNIIPREEREVIEDCHEAIISKEDWTRVQELIDRRPPIMQENDKNGSG